MSVRPLPTVKPLKTAGTKRQYGGSRDCDAGRHHGAAAVEFPVVPLEMIRRR